MTNYIWDSDDYPWGDDPGLDILKLEYDKLKTHEQSDLVLGINIPTRKQTSNDIVELMKQRGRKTNMPLHAAKVKNTTKSSSTLISSHSSINQSTLDKADKSVQKNIPLASGPNPATTVKLRDDIKAKIIPTPFHNTSTEQQTRNHYLSGSGSDVQLTDNMFKRAANYAQYQLGENPKDGSQVVSFYDNSEFNGTLGRATVHIKNGKVVGIEDYYDFDPKPWGERGYIEEIGTRLGHYPNAAPFNIYGGKYKKNY